MLLLRMLGQHNMSQVFDQYKLEAKDITELKAKVDTNKANGFEDLKELIDSNHDGILNNQDEAFKYVLLREDDNGVVTLFIPQVDNQRAKFKNTSRYVAQNNQYSTSQKRQHK